MLYDNLVLGLLKWIPMKPYSLIEKTDHTWVILGHLCSETLADSDGLLAVKYAAGLACSLD